MNVYISPMSAEGIKKDFPQCPDGWFYDMDRFISAFAYCNKDEMLYDMEYINQMLYMQWIEEKCGHKIRYDIKDTYASFILSLKNHIQDKCRDYFSSEKGTFVCDNIVRDAYSQIRDINGAREVFCTNNWTNII